MIFSTNYLTRRYEVSTYELFVTVTGLVQGEYEDGFIIRVSELDDIVKNVLDERKQDLDNGETFVSWELESNELFQRLSKELPQNVYVKNVRISPVPSLIYDSKARDFELQNIKKEK